MTKYEKHGYKVHQILKGMITNPAHIIINKNGIKKTYHNEDIPTLTKYFEILNTGVKTVNYNNHTKILTIVTA